MDTVDPIWRLARDLSWWLTVIGIYSSSMIYLSIVDLFKRQYKAATRFLIAAALGIPAFLLIVWMFPK